MNREIMIAYLETIRDLCSNGNEDDTDFANYLSAELLAHVQEGRELLSVEDAEAEYADAC